MVAIVHLDERWLVDVGFGGRVAEPLRLDERAQQQFGIRRYIVANDGDHWLVTCDEPGTPPMTYMFAMVPREFHEFEPVCRWLQTSPDSRFTQGDVVSLATPTGRITLSEGRLIVIEDGERTETDLAPADVDAVLRDRFGIALSDNPAPHEL
jgi:N-hydroxyarylamine O-acetyltransferase